MNARTSFLTIVALFGAIGFVAGCATAGRDERSATSIEGAWRVTETASRAPGEAWNVRPTPQGGLYVFSAKHYSYFYVRGAEPRARFADGNKPTDAEKAATFDTFIAGAGTYSFDGSMLALKADYRKNPNEMTREIWEWRAERTSDALRLVFVDPPFLPGQEWRVTLVPVE